MTTCPALRVLVIEDNPLLRAQLHGLLSAEGIEADFAGDGLSVQFRTRAFMGCSVASGPNSSPP